MEEKPKRKSSSSPIKLILAVVGISLLLCVGFFVGIFALTTTLLAPASDLTHGFMEALSNDEYEVAFDMFSSGLKSELKTADNLQTMIIEGNAKPESWTFNSQNVENNSGRFTGQVTLINGESVPIGISLVYENDEWRIIAFEWGN
jgi:hypothetical protein